MNTVSEANRPIVDVGVLETARVWALHLLCFVLPVTCFLFLTTAPHSWYGSLAWLSVLVASIWADARSRGEHRQPAATMPGWPFDSVLYVLVGLQILNTALLVRMVAMHGFWQMDTLVGVLLAGINAGYSGIVVAHELIHRSQRHFQQLGRLLLCTVLYEHFYTEHIRGHHMRVGTGDDPATARYGEHGSRFFLRTVPQQFRSAWRIEAKRLGDADMSFWDVRTLRNRVLHGLVAQWGVALAVLVTLGPGAFTVLLLQAVVAVRLLEAVNYFEHWGLTRTSRRVRTVDSWDTDSRFTLYTLVGLSRHADHHAYASRPYQQLRYTADSPKLPYGYFMMVVLVIFRNTKVQRMLAAELERRKLGPYAAAA